MSPSHSSRRLRQTPAPAAQRGAVLAMALIFLVILTLVSVYAMRGSIVGEQVSKNMRATGVAFQAAETALRYCEDQANNPLPTFRIQDKPVDVGASPFPVQWQTLANWADDSIVNEVPSDQLTAQGMRPLPVLPRCIVEPFDLKPAPGEDPRAGNQRTFLITAVGYSADFERDADGNAISGSEVWLQSIPIR